MLDVGLHFHCWCSGVLRLPAQSAKVEKVFEGEDSRGAHLLTLHLHDEINLAIVLMMRNCLQGKSSNCLLYKLPTFHYVPFWNLWASSVEFQRQDPKLHYNHWAFNEIPLLIRPTGSRQFPAVQLKADPSQLGIQTCSLTHSLHNVQIIIQKHY